MRGDEQVGALADAKDLEELQGIIVEPRGRAFVDRNRDALAGAFRREILVEPLARAAINSVSVAAFECRIVASLISGSFSIISRLCL